jgi:glutaredoxin 3
MSHTLRRWESVKPVKIYTSSNCYYCDRAKVLLGKKGVTYEEIDVEQNRDAMQEVVRTTGRRTLPQIFVGDLHVGGCDDLYALEAQGKLDAILELDR